MARRKKKKNKQQKERTARKEPKPKRLPHGLKQDIWGIVLLALAAFILFANLSGETGLVGLYVIKKMLRSLTGIGTTLLPVLFGILGALAILRRDPRQFSTQGWGGILAFFTILLVAQVVDPMYTHTLAGPTTGAGGVIGFLLRGAVENIAGRIGLYLAMGTLGIISLLLLMNMTLRDIGRFFFKRRTPEETEDITIETTLDALEKAEQSTAVKPEKTEQAEEPVAERPKKSWLKMPRATPPEPVGTEVAHLPLFSKADLEKSALHNKDGFTLPPFSLLKKPDARTKRSEQKLRESTEFRKRLLEEALRSFGVSATVTGVSTGPSVTRFEVQPDPGVKVSKIANLSDDIALNLAAHGVRIEAPIPGRSCVGIEVPNATVSTVPFSSLVRLNEFQQNPGKLFVAIGRDVAGTPIFGDLTKMPHLLIAGTTGSGKSVCLNALITSILMRARPDEVKFIMIDPKMVELTSYSNIPHLLAPVVTDSKKAAMTLKEWVLPEMERRYRDFNTIGVRNIQSYNAKVAHYEKTGKSWSEEFGFAPDYKPKPCHYIVVIVDELADLMMVASNEVEAAICRLAQMARATGIHLVIATQRPSVDVITGLIKANIPSRISFAVATQVDSRTILDSMGAEKLVGRGDMLYSPIGAMKPIRAQGAFITDDEINDIVGFLREQGTPEYDDDILTLKPNKSEEERASEEGGKDSLFGEALGIIQQSQQASTSYLQRKLRIGYNRAARLMDEIEAAGYVSPPEGEGKTRRILKSAD